MRITVQLIDALTGHHLFSERYDRDLKDILNLQDEITMKVLTAVQVKLTTGEACAYPGKGDQEPRCLFESVAGGVSLKPAL